MQPQCKYYFYFYCIWEAKLCYKPVLFTRNTCVHIKRKKKKKKGIRVCIYILSYVGSGTLNKNFVGATGY